MSYYNDVERAAQRRRYLMEQAEMERLAKEARRASPGTGGALAALANTGKLLVAVGTKLQEAAQVEGRVMSTEYRVKRSNE
jgi:hypothetical protein